jgi:simple sugar transport system ATP-binding protein
MDPILEIRNITKKFGGLTAVDDFNMHLSAGELVGLLGDNGAGKSTVIKMISGVYPPTKGQIFFQGKEIKIQNPMDALNMGIETVYQDLALAENLNVYSNIFLGREKLKKSFGLFNV